MTKTDEQLMAAYQTGGEEGVLAFDELYRRYAPKLYGYLRSRLRGEVEIKDTFQATWLRLHEARDKYDAQFPVGPWLFTLCRNVMLDRIRQSARRQEVELDADIATPPDGVAQPDLSDLPLMALRTEQRQVIEMRYLEEKSFADIAAKLEVSEVNARQLVSRALRRLRALAGGGKT